MSKTVFENVTARGKCRGYSLAEIAAAMGVSLGTLYNRKKEPDGFTLRELRAFACDIGVSLTDLLGGAVKTEAPTGESGCSVYPNEKCQMCSYEKPLGGCELLDEGISFSDGEEEGGNDR